jgi:hypothetical protein
MVVNWTDKVRVAITDLETKTGRVLQPDRALALIDDVVEGKLTAGEVAMIHGIPPEWVKTTLGHITRAVGTGRVRSLDAGGWFEFKSYQQPYDVASDFAAAWKEVRSPSGPSSAIGVAGFCVTAGAKGKAAEANPTPR